MLYRTHHHPLYFPCNPFPSFKSFSHPLSTTTSSAASSTTSQVDKMEMMVGFCQKTVSEDTSYLNTQNASSVSVSVPGEDFFVDQLLNLNDEDSAQHDKEEEDKDDKPTENGVFLVVKEDPSSIETEQAITMKGKISAFLTPPLDTHDFGTVLSVPAEEADLEWLSHFVEDSFSQFSTPYPVSEQPKVKGPETNPPPSFGPPSGLHKSRRSKRARTGGRVWSTSLAETTSSGTCTTSSGPTSPNPDPSVPRKQRKRENGPGVGSSRRCSHCGVQKTPQWRAGPLGSKTLCNACGVRFKSGRLLPEYRPACSPTFSSELHSNNHRKVLEMRKKKELLSSGPPEPGLSHPVLSFG